MSLDRISATGESLELFKAIFDEYGIDIARYKPGFMKRRIDRRMRLLDMNKYSEYAILLKNERSEFEELFLSLSINVTNFFRDFAVYEKFRSEIIPKVVSNRDKHDTIRIWSAGCASGEEPYSLAMMFTEEVAKFGNPIEIIANDISEKAIAHAQNGRYSVKSTERLPSDMFSKNFRLLSGPPSDFEYEVSPHIKNLISFKVCDILSTDAKQMDVIFCRNVLIYYEREAQELIMSKFYHSLKDGGYLVLGMDETMLGRRCERLFRPLMTRERIYKKVSLQN